MHTQRLIGADHRVDINAKTGPAALRDLTMSQQQVRFDAGIEQQADALTAPRAQPPGSRGKTIEAITLHVVNARITPVQRGSIDHVGMGDQATAGCRQQAGTWQGISSEPTDLTADARRHDHQRGQWRSGDRHGLMSTASTSSATRDVSEERWMEVIAQRNGSPSR